MSLNDYDVSPSFFEDVVFSWPEPQVICFAPWKSNWIIENEKKEAELSLLGQTSTQEDTNPCDSQDSFFNSQIVFERVCESVDSFDAPPATNQEEEVSCSECGSQMDPTQKIQPQNEKDEATENAEPSADSTFSQSTQMSCGSCPDASHAMRRGRYFGLRLCDVCLSKNEKHPIHKNPASFHRKTLFFCEKCATSNAESASLRDQKKTNKK